MEPSRDDGFKWFGEGFEGFPKRLPDDCVEYVIYLVDEKLKTPAATRARLNDILKASKELSKSLLRDYIWQREAFELRLHPDFARHDTFSQDPKLLKDAPQPLQLRGRTDFGDSVADEWLIVYILRELSKQFPEAWIRVYDTDGEFLLIEAANALPKWINPDVAENRVWLSNGHLRLIPVDEKSPSPPGNLTLTQALTFIQKQPEKLVISPYVEDEAFHRIREYPSAISSSLHHALITLPRRLAYILHHNPSYIAPAVEAFYLRDPIAVKPLATKDISTLQLPPEDFVTVSVKFTKVGFAQLRSQVFDAPPSWVGIAPRLKDFKVEMGMKLTCGFEMLLADPQNEDKRVVREIKLLLEDIQTGEEKLPTDKELATWPQTQDDEKWLDIDYNDFEAELSGKGKDGKADGFGDKSAQANLRKMVSRFQDLMDDDDEAAGIDGIDDDGDSSDEDSDSNPSSSGEDKDASFDEAEFERAMKEMMGMPADKIEQSGLLDEARRLAVQDAEEGSEPDEDEEMKKVMELMEKELKGHGALNLNEKQKTAGKSEGKKPVFGPPRPANMAVAKVEDEEEADEEIGPGDGELSSDDEEFNDVDLGLAKNMLEAFKGQAGMSGPAGNLMRAMGVNMPRDEDDGR